MGLGGDVLYISVQVKIHGLACYMRIYYLAHACIFFMVAIDLAPNEEAYANECANQLLNVMHQLGGGEGCDEDRRNQEGEEKEWKEGEKIEK